MLALPQAHSRDIGCQEMKDGIDAWALLCYPSFMRHRHSLGTAVEQTAQEEPASGDACTPPGWGGRRICLGWDSGI